MFRYFLVIGSNIDPRQNVPKIIKELLQISRVVTISRVFETAPIDIKSVQKQNFLNFVVMLDSTLDCLHMKQELNAIESRLGRDRAHPEKKFKNRTADIDILCQLKKGQTQIDLSAQELDPHERVPLIDLLLFLGYDCPPETHSFGDGVTLHLNDKLFGIMPTVIDHNVMREQASASSY